MIKSYKDLIVWQKGVELVSEVYTLTRSFPKEELFSMVSQMRRSAISIPANIAEGHSRRYRREYKQFVRIAFGSGAELETHIIISKRQKLSPESNFIKSDSLLNEVMKMLNTLDHSLTPNP